MNKWKGFAIMAGVILVALFLIPFLIPTSAYIGQAEQIASAKLGAPVKIESLRIALLPSPRLNINGLVIGKDKDIIVEQVTVLPALTSLFSEVKVLSSIKVKKPVIKKTALDILTAYSKQPSSTDKSSITIRQIIVEQARFVGLAMDVPALNAEVGLTSLNKPDSAAIESLDGKLRIKLTSGNGSQLIIVDATKWIIPVGPPLLIDKLAMQMALYDDRLEISHIDAALYKGKVTGNTTLNWDKGWRMSGKIKVDNVSVQEPVSLMAKSTRVSGSLFGNGSFNAKAKESVQLANSLNADFRFKVEHGVLYGLDLTSAASLLLHQGQKGGETEFDELSGVLNSSGKLYKFSNLIATSGLMATSGNVKINPDKTLDGVIAVEVKNSVSMAAIPLQVSGTVSDPVVFPTKAAMAGAVAGTAILGPGVGTSLGIKAGSAFDKAKSYFGGSK